MNEIKYITIILWIQLNHIMGPYLTVPKKEKDSVEDENSRVRLQNQ